jgi:hypothetical protein
VTSSASGFTYRIDPALGGVPVRSTTTFGAFYTERSLTIGRRQISFVANYQGAGFDDIDGRNLRDGTLRATASRLTSDPAPFDIETVTMRIRTDTLTVAADYGVSERLEVGAALPLERLTITGERLDAYRGTPLLQAAVSADASGPGDLVLRAKLNVLQRETAGIAVGAEGRLPTGSAADLLGAGTTTLKPRLIVSLENSRVALDTNVGYVFGGISDELNYSAAVTNAGAHKITLVGELVGRRLKFSRPPRGRCHAASSAGRRRNDSAQRGGASDKQSGGGGGVQVERTRHLAYHGERLAHVDRCGADGSLDVNSWRRVRVWRIAGWIRGKSPRRTTTLIWLTTSATKSGFSKAPAGSPTSLRFSSARSSSPRHRNCFPLNPRQVHHLGDRPSSISANFQS